MTVTCFDLDEGRTREFESMSFYLMEGNTVQITQGRAEEHSSGYKLFDDLTRETIVVYNKHILRLVTKAVDYDRWKKDSEQRQEKILKRSNPAI